MIRDRTITTMINKLLASRTSELSPHLFLAEPDLLLRAQYIIIIIINITQNNVKSQLQPLLVKIQRFGLKLKVNHRRLKQSCHLG